MATKKPYTVQPAQTLDYNALMANLNALPGEAAAEEKPSVARRIGDTAVQFGQGAVTGVKMMSDVFGANNAVSRGLGDVNQALDGLLSATAQGDKQKVAQIMQEAEGKGWGEQIVAGLKAAGVDPVGLAANALGTSLPTMATMLIPGAGPAAVAARMGAGVAMGAGQGVGAVKGQIYDETKRKWLEARATPEQAEAKAQEASAYGGENTDQIAIGGVLGMGSVLGAERALGKVLHGASKAGPGMLGRVATSTLAETGTEMLQGGQEKFATNTALNRQGFDVDPMSGVIANATLEGAAAAPMGAVAGIPKPAVATAPGIDPAKEAADTIRATEKVPESGTLTKAVNAGVEAKAQAVEAGAPVTTQPGAEQTDEAAPEPVDDPVRDQILALPDGARQDALRAYAVVNRTDVAKGVQQYNRKLLDRLLAKNEPSPEAAPQVGGIVRNFDPKSQPTNTLSLAPMGDATYDNGIDFQPNAQSELARRNAELDDLTQRAPRVSTAPVDLSLPTDPVQNYVGNLRSVNTPAARAYVRDFDAGRITAADVQQRMQAEKGLTPEQRLARAASEAPAQTDPVADRLARAAAQGMATPAPTDILNPSGEPFKTKMAADRAAKKSPGAAVLPVVDGGFLVRPQEPVNVQDVPQAPEVSQAAPVVSPPGQAPQAVGTQPAGPAAGVPAEGAGAVEAAGVKPAGQRQLSADEQAAQDREEARAKELSLPPALSARLQEAHKAHGRDVKRSVVERSIANEKANNTGTPKAKRERADRIARLEADLALFDEAAAMPPKEAAGLTENKVGRKDSAQIAQPESVVGGVQHRAAPSAITPTTTQGNADGHQASQAQQAATQPAQAGAATAAGPAPANTAAPATAGASTVRALSDAPTPQNIGAQAAPAAGAQAAPAETKEQRTQRVAAAGEAWTRMPTVEREAMAGRADGLNPMQRKSVQRAAWADLNRTIQSNLADAMGGRVEAGGNQTGPGTQQAQAQSQGAADQSSQIAEAVSKADRLDLKGAERAQWVKDSLAGAWGMTADEVGDMPEVAAGLRKKPSKEDATAATVRRVEQVVRQAEKAAAINSKEDAPYVATSIRVAKEAKPSENRFVVKDDITGSRVEWQALSPAGDWTVQTTFDNMEAATEAVASLGIDPASVSVWDSAWNAKAKRFTPAKKREADRQDAEMQASAATAAPQAEAAPAAATQQVADDFLPEGWSKSINGYTKRPVYRMEQGGGQPFAVVTQVEGMQYEVQIRHGDKQLTTSNQTGALSEVLAKAEAELTRMTQADSVTHQDPGEKAEAATPAVVTDSLKKAARNEDTKPSEMRKWLVGKIDEAIAVAPEAAVDFLSFDVPGDGTFKVQNSQARLQEFRKKVMASPGFKDGGQKQNTKPLEQVDSAINGSGSTVEAIRNFLADGDVQSAVEFAKLKGVEFTPVPPQMKMSADGKGKVKHMPASVKSSVPSVAEGLTQVEAEQINQYLTAERQVAETVAQPITRADVETAKKQAAAIITERIDAMTAGEVNTIARRFLPTMGVKPTVSKERNKAAMTDSAINLEAAAAEVGATLPADVRRVLQADMEGRVAADGFVEQGDAPMFSRTKAITPAQRAENFARWSDNAPLISSEQAEAYDFKTGQKIVVEAFHGSARPDRIGGVFDPKRATSGPMAYFTSSPELASSYAKGKEDTSLADEDQSYANWFKFKPPGARSAVSIDRAWHFLTPEVQARIRKLAPRIAMDDTGENIVIDPDNTDGLGNYGWELQQARGNPLAALVESWLTSGTLFNEETQFMDVLRMAGFPVAGVEMDFPNAAYPGVFKTYVSMKNPLVVGDMPAEVRGALEAAAKADRSRAKPGADMWDKRSHTLRDWWAKFTDPDPSTATYAWTSIPDKVTDILKAHGYDGIVDWSGKGGGHQSPVYIPFGPTQVKSVFNRGTFDPTKKDISFGRGANAAIGTPAATIRAAITKAYGKLLGQLESKGLVTLTQTEDEAIEAAAQARAKKTGGDVAQIKRSLTAAMQGGTDLDVKRSANGAVQGFFDPQTGQSFLIADNLTAEAAPGVLMHEVGIHMAADGSMKALFNRAAMMLKLQRGNPFMKAVQDRMDAAGETSGEEAAAYIAEAYENDRANAPASVQRWLADLLAAVKAWMFKKGIMGADRLTVADIAAVARANARSMARDGGATGGQGFGTAFSRAPAGDQTQTEAFKRWFAGSRVVDADGKPMVVYHGTRRPFNEFSPSRPRGAPGNPEGIYFTADKWAAEEYAQDADGAWDEKSRVVSAYIKIENDADGKIIDSAYRGREYVVFKPENIKSSTSNNGSFDPANPDIRFSRTTAQSIASSMGDMTPDQEKAYKNVAGVKAVPTVRERMDALKANLGLKLRQGLVDQFAAIKQLDQNAYVQARMSKGTDGTLEAILMYGKPFMRDGAPDVDIKDGGFAKVLASLKGEQDRWMMWIAAQRAEKLKADGKENLMTNDDISALMTLNAEKMADGTARMPIYDKALAELNEYNDAMLKLAMDSGLIDQAAYDLMAGQPYVPFYRLMEDGDMKGPKFSSGLTNQKAWQKLKGGTQQLNADLLQNMLLNWSHLLQAAAKNRAATATMDAAEKMAVAYKVDADTKGSVKVMRDGSAEYWMVEDPYLLDAISAIHYVPSPLMKPLAKFKQLLTWGVTVNPTFKIRNLIRDSVSAIAQADLGYNPAGNVAKGWKLTAKDSQIYASMLASGGLIKFGTQENTDRLRAQVAKLGGVVLDKSGTDRFFGQIKDLYEVYNEFGDRAENVNRAALYDALIKKGKSHAEAAFMARDLMDFSMSGSAPVVRFLTQAVPFLNARLVGLDKLGRAAMEDPRRFATVTGAVALASLALLAAYSDDDDWKKREDWDRDAYWWFKVGEQAYRIPKPFEVGAIGTLAERTAELMLSDEMTGKRYMERVSHMLSGTFSFNPVPQAFKPLLDLYANKDSFTGRAIESQADQRLRPQDRYSERTPEVAKFLGGLGLPDPAQLVKGEYSALSPKQVEHLIRGYFSWVGTAAMTVSDFGLRPLADRGERPDMRLKDVFIAGNFVENLPTGSSRYVTQMYEQSRQVEQAYASYQEAIKAGDTEKAQSIKESAGPLLRNRPAYTAATRQLAEINRTAKRIEADQAMAGAAKRARLTQLEQQRQVIAQRVSRLATATP